MIGRFRRTLSCLYARWGHLLKTMIQQWLAPVNLQLFADTIHARESPLDNCWGYIDGTVRPICRLRKDQRILYNGHKKVHAIKFQLLVAPNGLITNLYGPVEGRHHGSGMLIYSALFRYFQQYAHGRTTTFFVCMAIRRTLFDHNLWVLFKVQQEHPFKIPGIKP